MDSFAEAGKHDLYMIELDPAPAKRLKALERENAELRKMYAEAMLGQKVLKEALEKSCERGAPAGTGAGSRGAKAMQPTASVPIF